MAMGMSYDQYWYGDVRLARTFLQAERIRQRRRYERANAEAHLYGLYFYEALCDASPLLHAFAKKGTKARPYRAKPYALHGQDEDAREERALSEEADALRAKLYMQNLIRAGKNWGG